MEITKVDLLGPKPGGAGWDDARDAVTASVVTHGFVLVQHGGLDKDMRQELFGRAMPEIFKFPVETKRGNVYRDVKYGGIIGGYIGQIPGQVGYEGLGIDDVADAGLKSNFVKLFWPQGNPSFCEASAVFATNGIELLQTVMRMVLEGLGVRDKHALALALALAVDSQHDQLRYNFRMSYYGASPDDEEATIVCMPEHRDQSLATVIMQHEVEGLEVKLNDGSWFAVPPEPDTWVVLAGTLLTVVTNGRVPACLHRVNRPSDRERFSALVGVHTQGSTVRAMEELVDEAHPLMYHPFHPYQYFAFEQSEQGRKCKDALKTFCGVVKDDDERNFEEA